jgi:hypothetical protein
MSKVWENKTLNCFVKETVLSKEYSELDLVYESLHKLSGVFNEFTCYPKELLYMLVKEENLQQYMQDSSTLRDQVIMEMQKHISGYLKKAEEFLAEYTQTLRKSIDALFVEACEEKCLFNTEASSDIDEMKQQFDSLVNPYLKKAQRKRKDILESTWNTFMLSKIDFSQPQPSKTIETSQPIFHQQRTVERIMPSMSRVSPRYDSSNLASDPQRKRAPVESLGITRPNNNLPTLKVINAHSANPTLCVQSVIDYANLKPN